MTNFIIRSPIEMYEYYFVIFFRLKGISEIHRIDTSMSSLVYLVGGGVPKRFLRCRYPNIRSVRMSVPYFKYVTKYLQNLPAISRQIAQFFQFDLIRLSLVQIRQCFFINFSGDAGSGC